MGCGDEEKENKDGCKTAALGDGVPLAEVPLGEIHTGTRVLSWTF